MRVWTVMSTPDHQRWWTPRHPVDVMTAVWSAAEHLPLRPGTGAAYQTLFLALRRVALGRTFTADVAGAGLQVTVSEIVSLLDPLRLIRGELDVRLSLTEIRWGEYEFDPSEVVLRRVALRSGTPPVVSATPVEVRLDVPSATLDAMLRDARPGMSAHIDDDGVPRVRWARRPGWGNVECELAVAGGADGPALTVSPRAVIVAGRRLRVPAGTSHRLSNYRLALDRLPPGVEVTGVHCRPGALRVHATLPQWRLPR